MNAPESLRQTDTNSADDSAGSVWGFEGGLFWIVLIGLLLSLGLLLLLFTFLLVPLVVAAPVAALPLIGAIAYAIHRQTSPKGYDVDLLDRALNGRGFGPQPTRSTNDDDSHVLRPS